MKIDVNTIASLYYTLTDKNTEEILQAISEKKPEEFLFGHGLMIDFFEKNLYGLEENSAFDFVINCDDAYGPIDPSAIFDLPITTFANEDGSFEKGILQIGNIFPMEDNDGYRHHGKIIRIMESSVTMDFNHPLAGKNLRFQGKIIGIRKQNAHDLSHFAKDNPENNDYFE